ncbi:MAG: hypothetical protein M1826_004764 [Phylliscum demangeonii]|nr:MAG: hypothetical protein M1826_004764 [Phylliscum demangeonii]
MTVSEIVQDDFLHSVLEVSTLTRDQCMAYFDVIEAPSDAGPGPATMSGKKAHLQLRKQHQLLHSYLSQLRGLSRDAIVRVRDAKQTTADARQEVDELHLHLQNLYYEQRHLRQAITACEGYDHKYQRLPLKSVDDFLQQHPERAEDDENALMIARIHEEYTQREALEQARQGLLKKKQSLMAENKKRREDLASLDRDLEKFMDAAKPIQKLFETDR